MDTTGQKINKEEFNKSYRTFDEWNTKGFRINKGERGKKGKDGKWYFHKIQVYKNTDLYWEAIASGYDW